MKFPNILFLLLLGSLFLNTGCNDDEDPPEEQDISGTWKLESMDYTVESTVAIAAQAGVPASTSVSTTDGEATNIDAFLDFTSTDYSATGSYDIEGTSTTDGNASDFSVTMDDITSNGTYTQEGDEITFMGTLMQVNVEDFEFDFDFPDIPGFEFEIPDFNISDQLQDAESTAVISSFDGNNMTLTIDQTETTEDITSTNTTVMSQTMVLSKQ